MSQFGGFARIDDVRASLNDPSASLLAALPADHGATLVRPTDAIIIDSNAGASVHLLAGTLSFLGGSWQAQAAYLAIGANDYRLYDHRLNGIGQDSIAVDRDVIVIL